MLFPPRERVIISRIAPKQSDSIVIYYKNQPAKHPSKPILPLIQSYIDNNLILFNLQGVFK